jgi:ribosomal protein S18 acetylase RimI-like enzyme
MSDGSALPGEGIRIRKMKPEDMQAVLDILSGWNMAPLAPTEDNPDPERSAVDTGNSFVAVDGSTVDGSTVVGIASYIILDEERAETASLAVDPAYRGMGIGRRLQAARLREMKKRGIRRVRTESDRPETIRWYVEKFGYRVVGTKMKKHPFSLPEVDRWTVLELELY